MHDHLFDLEKMLLTPATRNDRETPEKLLAEDFFEFGSSGKIWSRKEIIDDLAEEAPANIAASGFKASELTKGVVLVTYKTERAESDGSTFNALRSSIWKEGAAGWTLFFHQGTRIP